MLDAGRDTGCQASEDAEDVCPDYFLAKAARALGRQRLAALARKMIYRLQRRPAVGTYGDDYELRTLWDEYCFEVQNGPTDALDLAWNAFLGPHLTSLSSPSSDAEGIVLSAAAGFELNDAEFDREPGNYPEMIGRGIRLLLDGMAMNRSIVHMTDP